MHLLGNGLTPQQYPGTLGFAASLSQLALGLSKVRLGGANTGLVRPLIDQEQQVPLLDQFSLFKRHFLNIATHPGS